MPYPARKTWEVKQGSTFDQTLTVRIDGVLVDYTGYTAAMQVRKTDGTLLISLDSDSGIVLGGANGTIQIYISASVMADTEAGKHLYDLELTSPNGTVINLMSGWFEVIREITR